MNFSNKIIFLSVLIMLVFVACRKDTITDTMVDEPVTPPTTQVESGLIGRVFDENSEPVLNAAVELAGQMIRTDSNGVFFFNHLNLNEAGDFVKIEKQGYFLGSRRFYPTLGNENYVEIKLLPKTPVGTVDAMAGGMVETADGAMIRLPAGGIIDSDGNTFTGEVNVFAKFINPVASDLHQIMPANLEGKNIEGTNVALETYGMLAVELESNSGEPLNLGNDKTAKLGFPIPAELLNTAPAEIPLWSLDEEEGIWVEEGKAAMDGSFYVGEVAHFSFWNCDDPFELVELEGCFIDENGLSLTNVKVKITNLTTGNCGFGMTDSNGCFKGKVPKNEPLKLELLSSCNVSYYSEDIGSFSDSEDLGLIQATGYSDQFFTPILKGRVVDCDGNVIGDDMVLELDAGGVLSYFSINGSGFEIPGEHCEDLDSITIRAKYITGIASEVSLPIVVYPDSSEQLIGDLTICSNDMAYMKVTIDNDTYTYFYSDSTAFALIDNDPNTPTTVNLIVFKQTYTPTDSSDITLAITMDNINLGDVSDIAGKPTFTYGNLTGLFDIREKFWGLTKANAPSSVKINRIGGKGGFVQGETEFIFQMWNGFYDDSNGYIQPRFQPDGGNLIEVAVKVEFNLLRII